MARNQWNDKLRQKMEAYTQQPPDGLWEAVEAGLPQQKAVFPSWVWAFAGVAAALFAVMLIWPKGSGKATLDGEAVAVVAQDSESLPEAVSVSAELAGDLSPAPEAAAESAAESATEETSESAAESAVEPAAEAAVSADDAADARDDKAATVQVGETQEERTTAGEDEGAAAGKADEAEPGDSERYGAGVLIPLERTKSAFRPNLTASLLAGGIPGNASGSYDSYGLSEGVRAGVMSLKKSPVGLLSRNKATRTEVSHSVALRVGVLAQLSFSEHWGVESGLQLSSLESATKSVTGNMTAATEKTMSYLGVPLHVVYTPFRFGSFSLYASAGPMFEYGFRSASADESYIGSERVSYSTTTRRENDSIWSLGANLGAQWNVGGMGGLFIQPGVSYHFAGKDNQESFYTAHPLSFALSAGFRFMF